MSCRILFWLMLSAFLHKASAQPNYMVYYSNVNEAQRYHYQKDYKKAVDLYLKTFSTFKGFERDYYKAVNIANRSGNYEATYKLLQLKILNTGWFNESVYDSSFNGFKRSSFWKKFSKEYPGWEATYEKSVDWKAYGFLRDLGGSDQCVRSLPSRKYMTMLTDSVRTQVISQFIKTIDEDNLQKFKRFVQHNGFPNLDKIGRKNQEDYLYIHWFNPYPVSPSCFTQTDSLNFTYLDTLFRKAIVDGNLDRSTYAYIYDYKLDACLDKSYFGTIRYTLNDNMERVPIVQEIIDVEHVDERRAAIGLPSVREEYMIQNIQLPPNYK